MEYFELTQSTNVLHAIQIYNLDPKQYLYRFTKEKFDELPDLKVGYFSGSPAEEVCDVLIDPTFMVSEAIKQLLSLYDDEIRWKAIQLFPLIESYNVLPLYWVPLFAELSCLHADTRKYDSGTLEHLVLDRRCLLDKDIFCVGGLLEHKVIVSLPVAESLLRRRMYGIGLKKVMVK